MRPPSSAPSRGSSAEDGSGELLPPNLMRIVEQMILSDDEGPPIDASRVSSFLDTHDEQRFARRCHGDEQRVANALSLLLLAVRGPHFQRVQPAPLGLLAVHTLLSSSDTTPIRISCPAWSARRVLWHRAGLWPARQPCLVVADWFWPDRAASAHQPPQQPPARHARRHVSHRASRALLP